MFERFTERARQVITLAQEEARDLNHGWIDTGHLLLGLLREGEGIAARVLAVECGVTIEATRAAYESKDAPPLRLPGPAEQLPFTPRAKKTLELSLREALSLGHNYIGTEHILLGLVRESESVGARILINFGVDPERIRNEVLRQLSGPGRRQKRQVEPPTVRSPDRIRPILVVVEEYWRAHPDLRLGQLIGDLASVAKVDPYAIEDGELLDAIWKAQ